MSQQRNSIAVTGSWRAPVNSSADEKGGIHDDDTASGLGFAGGTVAGSIHMEQFPPLLVQHFGEDWWQRGSLSLYFLQATQHREPVRCQLQPVNNSKAEVWMENESGERIMAGTAGLGDDPESEVKQRVAAVRPASDIRMFADVVLNQDCDPVPTRTTAAEVAERLAVITEPMPCYTDASVYGVQVVPMAALVHLMRAAEPQVAPIRGAFVGLFGAVEIQYMDGPVFAERDYQVTGRALALSESPKTEIIWHAHSLKDADSGKEVARMIKMDRLLKGASPLWVDEGA